MYVNMVVILYDLGLQLIIARIWASVVEVKRVVVWIKQDRRS